MRHNIPGAGNVATTGAKRLGEGPHHDIHIQGVDVPVLTDAPAMLAHCSYTVCFIQEQVCLKQTSKLFAQKGYSTA